MRTAVHSSNTVVIFLSLALTLSSCASTRHDTVYAQRLYDGPARARSDVVIFVVQQRTSSGQDYFPVPGGWDTIPHGRDCRVALIAANGRAVSPEVNAVEVPAGEIVLTASFTKGRKVTEREIKYELSGGHAHALTTFSADRVCGPMLAYLGPIESLPNSARK